MTGYLPCYRSRKRIAAIWLAIGLLCCGKPALAQQLHTGKTALAREQHGVAPEIPREPQLPQLLRELSAPQDSIAYIQTLGKIGALYLLINLDSSFTYAVREQEMSQRWEYKNGLADAYDVMSYCYALRTDFNIAAIYGYKALQLHKALSDSARMAKTLSNLYLYYRNMGRPADAGNYFYEAFGLAGRLPAGDDSIYSILLVNYAMRFYKDSTRQDSVQWAWRRAAQISVKYPYSRLPLYITAYAADTLVKQGRGKEAEAIINELAAAALKSGWPYVAMDIYNHLEDYGRMGYQVDSTHYRELSYELARKAGCIELNLATLAGLFDDFRKRNDMAKMSYYSKEIMRLATQPRYQPERDKINYIAFFLKEQALQLLTRSNQQQLLELEKVQTCRKQAQFVIAGLFVIVILLFILLFSRYRQYIRWKEQERRLSDSYTRISLKNVSLRANDEFKNKLITIIANDFRAPLHYISTVATQLRNRQTDTAEMAVLIKKIAAVSGSTLCVFDNILKWIRMQLSGFVYRGMPCKLHDITGGVLKHTAGAIEEKGLVVMNRVPVGYSITADPEMLRVALLQLVRLSARYAQQDSLLILSAWYSEGRANIRLIADAGYEADRIVTHLENWHHDMYALSFAITGDFFSKMKGSVKATVSDGKYLVFTGMLNTGKEEK
ncbi:histidine kinase [Chitinophaga arvensicola]|uniref:Signal transduction histidine kinase n=1 Tax=Chitinophaga arvensicola TaxID=29529 RepID=A0A1I0QRM3_9BACT|nr:HAMP domain-containing histidine kinase [Chitinophaga arvensicola]SEW30027.1 Signal transduction histidine kinase [Chitinophaga arvensicola]